MAFVRRLVEAVIGRSASIPSPLLARYPELGIARLRRGGLPLRIGGWALGRRSVAGITLGRTIFLAPDAVASAELLLHELRHVHQFQSHAAFPLRYLLESARRGYRRNRFEIDARWYAAQRSRGAAFESLRQDS